ncbi:MAG: ferritin-like domain-containing protein [Labilithrix sp.]|nr:ferritin-like domain-containing protein [Labilithrix sp.]MCW5810333.1 ferritin-like domain-containing protein [Labilithrix sp.]
MLVRLRQVAALALASSAASGLACDGETEPASPSTVSSTSTSSSSSSGSSTSGSGGSGVFAADDYQCSPPLAGIAPALTPATPVDYLELRRQVLDADGGLGAARAAAKVGTACATATDKGACTASLETLGLSSPMDGWSTNGDPIGALVPDGEVEKELLVYTRGDEVGAVRTEAELRAFLGTIDSLEEARMLLLTRNVPFTCTSTPAKSGWKQNPDGSYEILAVGVGCGTFIKYRWHFTIAKDGTVTGPDRDPQLEPDGAVCGRRPDGLAALSGGAASGLRAYLAQAAHLEAASVVAFRRLETELRAHGAPATLVARARRSRTDEIRHAREMSALARQAGAVVPPVVVDAPGARDLFAIALENAVEGCVRETYGAVVALFQAERAATELRPILARIARDEVRHAELAHDVAAWLEPQLTPSQRAALADARARATEELRAALRVEPHEEVRRIAGVPSAFETRILLDGLTGELAA